MLHLLPESDFAAAPAAVPGTVPEPLTRIASIRNALRVVDQFGGGPASDFDVDELSGGWEDASDAERRCFDRRSAALVALASDGLEVVAGHREQGGDTNPAALRLLADQIRDGLAGLEALIRR